ncbi:condensation domain-containing protein, partial [uncultured Chitinophaga sp.]|uniref:condensation domain-containing protein n=1 Tax=uncultured Chitinophaga sp. TaxID=339340 RepID=UPI002635FF5F
LGGEQVTKEQVRILKLLNSGMAVYNEYGPTETTVGCIVKELQEDDPQILIGKPITATEIFILGEAGQLCPIGVTGEICIAGAGLAKQYLNNHELTAQKFVPNPYRTGSLMYRTGDLGRWLPQGEIQYIGRKDEQLKIRGYRIEPGEIENALLILPDVSAAVVTTVLNTAGEPELAAYLSAKRQLDIAGIRNHLTSCLPAYMLPVYYMQLEVLPLTSNGKVDKKKLPAPGDTALGGNAIYVPPANEVEWQLAEIWHDILGKEKIGINDNFFDLGGHSLTAIRLLSQLQRVFHVKMELKDIFAQKHLADQARLIQLATKTNFVLIPTAPPMADYPLSSAQRRIWVLSQFEEGSVAYKMPAAYSFDGDLDITALSAAFNSLIRRHESLRTVFRVNDQGEPRQLVLPADSDAFQVHCKDLQGQSEEVLLEYIQQYHQQSFDLSKGPLIRAALFQVDTRRWVFTCVMHHICSDEWSAEILIRELLLLYSTYSSGEQPSLDPLKIQYKDYACWQQEQFQGDEFQLHKSYWRKQLEGRLPVIVLPLDKSRPVVKSYNGNRIYKGLNSRSASGLKTLCRAQNATLFMGLVATVTSLLHQYGGQQDIIIGSPIAGRQHADLEDQIGFYLNTLPLRLQLQDGMSFNQLLQCARLVTLDANEHQAYPFDQLIDDLQLQRDMSRSPLFDVLIDYHDNKERKINSDQLPGGLKISPFDAGTQTVSKFDLTFMFIDSQDGL